MSISFGEHAVLIATKNMRRLVRDRRGLLMLVIVPIVLMAIVGFSLQGFETEGTRPSGERMGLLVQDEGRYGRHFVRALEAQGVRTERVHTLPEIRTGVAEGRWSLAIVVPAEFSEPIEVGGNGQVHLLLAGGPVDASTGQLIGDVYVAAGYVDAGVRAGRAVAEEVRRERLDVDPTAMAMRVEEEVFGSLAAVDRPTVGVAVRQNTTGAGDGDGRDTAGLSSGGFFDQVVPGYAVMFALFGIGAGAATLLEEKERGTYDRLLAAPVSAGAILLGTMLFQFVLTFAQVLILLSVGVIAFGLEIRLWSVALGLVFGLSLATTAFGMLLVSIARSPRHLRGLTTIVVLGFSAIGGSWWPLWLQPEWLQHAAMVSVTYWAMRGFNALLVFQEPAVSIVPRIGALLVYALVSFGLAWALFERRQFDR